MKKINKKMPKIQTKMILKYSMNNNNSKEVKKFKNKSNNNYKDN